VATGRFSSRWRSRVLVRHIEGFCSKAEWTRAYGEINEFEKQLADDGVHVIKLLIHVSAESRAAHD
jgi:polyphosphate kinase 2 (PPK2 family)